ncbi:hypothetical protein BMS3Abin17_00065 [archaeon BMS3Abin17]|nr:hypothetical protein BMS3Abin17_00065 [archaeon BMS3Abin17]
MNFFKAEKDKEFQALGLKDQSRSLKVSPNQTGRTIVRIDKKRKALAPGKRVSSSGKVYWESRANRSDKVGEMV